MGKKVITILSDALTIPTGYANQARQLAKHWHDQGHEIHYLGNAYNGSTISGLKLEDGQEYNFKMYGSMVQDYFANTMSQHLKETKSDYFFILLDTFMLHGHPENPQAGWFLNIDTSPAKTIFWFPSDGGRMPSGCELILKKVDIPIAMARFGQKQVKDYHGINALHIPHGCDTKRFYRMQKEERDKLRAKWGLTDKFVIGVVARNQPRKHLDRTIKVMAMLRDKIPNAVLLCHFDPHDPAQQMFNLPKLINYYKLENRIIFTGMKAHKGFGWDKMNEVYNLMDVFLLTTSGEGFGIPIIEAMACQVPVLATDYTTTPELVIENKAGLGINLSGVETIEMFKEDMPNYDMKVLNGTLTGNWEVERGICSITDAVHKLIWIKDHPVEANIMGLNGRKAVLEKYDFEIVAKQFDEVIK